MIIFLIVVGNTQYKYIKHRHWRGCKIVNFWILSHGNQETENDKFMWSECSLSRGKFIFPWSDFYQLRIRSDYGQKTIIFVFPKKLYFLAKMIQIISCFSYLAKMFSLLCCCKITSFFPIYNNYIALEWNNDLIKRQWPYIFRTNLPCQTHYFRRNMARVGGCWRPSVAVVI